MERIGCIVMYSKPLEKHKTVPKGTIFYTDGTEKEISLKEAANLALEMAMDYGYINAIDNERYFNTTYAEFMSNKERYKEIATGKKKEENPEVKKTVVDKDTTFRNLPPDIVEVDPPKVVKDETTKKEEKVEKPEEVVKTIMDVQEVYGPAPEEYVEEVKVEPEEVQPVEEPEKVQPEEEPEDIDYEEIERKLNEMLDKALAGDTKEESSESDLIDMIEEQNKDIDDTGTKKR